MKKRLLIALLALASATSCAFGLTACNSNNKPVQDSEYRNVYAAYAAQAKTNGDTVLSYEDWLDSIKGDKGEKGDKGDTGDKGETGEPGKDGASPHIGDNGNWFIGDTDTGIKAQGTQGDKGETGEPGKDGKSAYELYLDTYQSTNGSLEGALTQSEWLAWLKGDKGDSGLSAYELYVTLHPEYEGTLEDWIKDLVSGRLQNIDTKDIDFIPEINLTVAVGEDIKLPQKINVYFADGSVKKLPVSWVTSPSSAFIGLKKIKGTVEALNAEVICNVKVTNYSTNDKYINGYVNGLLPNDDVLITLYNDTYLSTVTVSDNGYYSFENIENGEYYLKIDANGYEAVNIQKVTVSNVNANSETLYDNIAHAYFDMVAVRTEGYYFVWDRTDILGNTETVAYVNSSTNIEFLDDTTVVSDMGSASYLRDKHNVVLLDSELKWSTETSSRFLELYERLPKTVTSNLKSVWTLTNSHLLNDIEFTQTDGVWNVTVSVDAIQNITPRVALVNNEKGKYFSNRFYNALVRFVTDNGTNEEKCESILNENFLTSFNVPDYTALTSGITDEDQTQFQEFYPEEKLLILTMFEEMPSGMHKMKELKYLVRRKTGQTHPIYPSAAAVTWTKANQPYIEFMDVAFSGKQGYYDTKRLIIHEKTHMFWEYYFSDALKEEWYKVGGWYPNEADADGWSTTKQTEFVSAYAHAHNPDEDMAESVATYVINPKLLLSRAPAKYEFIKNYIMGGSFYLTQIREDLTFEVYNLNPDYTYPGQIDRIAMKVTGGLYEDKTVNFEITLHGGDEFEGANGAYFRLLPGDSSVSQYYDVGLSKADEKGLILTGSITMSKYSYKGYWFTDQITLIDDVGNERYESNADYSLKLYLDNPLYDAVSPELVRGSLQLSLENANVTEHPDAQNLVVKFKFIEDVYLDKALVRLYCKNATKDSVDTYAKDLEINRETGEVIMRVYIPEHYSNGIYEISEVSLTDLAGNNKFYHIDYGTLVEENNTIEINTKTPDNDGPVMDENNIKVSAVPSVPEQPNGETFVTINITVSDNISGIKNGYINFLDPQGKIHGYWIYFPNYNGYYFDGDPTKEVNYSFNFTLPKGSAPGTWGIYEISLTDYALNTSVYNFVEIIHFEVDNQN